MEGKYVYVSVYHKRKGILVILNKMWLFRPCVRLTTSLHQVLALSQTAPQAFPVNVSSPEIQR